MRRTASAFQTEVASSNLVGRISCSALSVPLTDRSRCRVNAESPVGDLAEHELEALSVVLGHAVLVRDEEDDEGSTLVPGRSVSDPDYRSSVRLDDRRRNSAITCIGP